MTQIPTRTHEIALPQAYWGVLSTEDKAEYMKLRANFLQGQKISSKDRRIVTFRKELIMVLKYIQRTEVHQEERSVLVGVCFAGPVICVNTRQLKGFLGRCKSSINGSFQQMGYVALRTKAKARSCVVAVMPSLQNDQNILRQWTVRYAGDEAQFCFLSTFSSVPLPQITEDDLYDEKKPQHPAGLPPLSRPQMNPALSLQQIQAMQRFQHFQAPSQNPQIYQQAPPPAVVSTKPRQIEFDLPSLEEIGQYEPEIDMKSDIITSLSVDYLSQYETEPWNEMNQFDPPGFDWDPISSTQLGSKPMTHSLSAFVPSIKDFSLLD